MNSKWLERAWNVAWILLFLGACSVVVNRIMGIGETQEQLNQANAENTQLAAANLRITELQEALRRAEAAHAQSMHQVSSQYQEDLKHVQTSHDATLAAVRAGTVRLHAPVKSCPTDRGGATSSAGASSGGRNDAARAELSAEASADLVRLASDADVIVHQLTACQAVVRADRTNFQPEKGATNE